MAYTLIYDTNEEHLYEHRTDDQRLAVIALAQQAGKVSRSISGCEARQYVGQDRPHSTGLVKRSDGTVGRFSY